MPKKGILERLKEGIVLGDGGYLLELEHRGVVQAGPYTPEIALEHPEALKELYREFKDAGAEVLQALTFYGNQEKLALVHQSQSVEKINRAAVKLAREVAGSDLLVAGSITQTLSFAPSNSSAVKQAARTLEQQVAALEEADVDFFIGETFIFLEEALLALEIMKRTERPVMITLCIGPGGSKDRFSPAQCARRLTKNGADIVGVNCSFDPKMSLAAAREMKKAADVFIACQPIAYRTPNQHTPFTRLPEFPLALEPLQLTRFDMRHFALQAQESGINYVGGCCGVSPYHVRAMAEALGRKPQASKKSADLSRHVFNDVRKKNPSYWSTLVKEAHETSRKV